MLLGALIDAGAGVDEIQQVLNLIPRHFARCKNVKLGCREVNTHGFRACRAELAIAEEIEETSAEELIRATRQIADSSSLTDEAKSFANNSIRLLTEVESQLHGVAIPNAHLHEAGSADTLADIFGVATACDLLSLFDGGAYSCPIAVGRRTVTFSHGTVSVPSPAVLEIARRYHIPIMGGSANEELATPTGVTLLASLVDAFVEAIPLIVPEKVGYGAGKRELANSPNVLRVIIGQLGGQRFDHDSIQVIETNLDDVSGEVVGSSLQRILDAGVKDAWVTPAQFKKNRPGYTLHAICAYHDLEKISEIIMRETGTLGVRYQPWNRFVLSREIVLIRLQLKGKSFDVRVKVAKDRSGNILRIKPEFEDVDSISRAASRPTREISALALEEARKSLGVESGA
jgi:hypothetical protein